MTTINPEQPTTNAPSVLPSWQTLVRDALKRCGGTAPLAVLYGKLAFHPRAKINPHWKAKIRQCVQKDPLVEWVSRGVWRLKP